MPITMAARTFVILSAIIVPKLGWAQETPEWKQVISLKEGLNAPNESPLGALGIFLGDPRNKALEKLEILAKEMPNSKITSLTDILSIYGRSRTERITTLAFPFERTLRLTSLDELTAKNKSITLSFSAPSSGSQLVKIVHAEDYMVGPNKFSKTSLIEALSEKLGSAPTVVTMGMTPLYTWYYKNGLQIKDATSKTAAACSIPDYNTPFYVEVMERERSCDIGVVLRFNTTGDKPIGFTIEYTDAARAVANASADDEFIVNSALKLEKKTPPTEAPKL